MAQVRHGAPDPARAGYNKVCARLRREAIECLHATWVAGLETICGGDNDTIEVEEYNLAHAFSHCSLSCGVSSRLISRAVINRSIGAGRTIFILGRLGVELNILTHCPIQPLLSSYHFPTCTLVLFNGPPVCVPMSPVHALWPHRETDRTLLGSGRAVPYRLAQPPSRD